VHNDVRHFEEPQVELRIVTNRGGGSRVFSNLQELHLFSNEAARDVATLTAILMKSTSDEQYIAQTLALVNDLAFQLQQSVELISEASAAL
jgi:hypothetical protein